MDALAISDKSATRLSSLVPPSRLLLSARLQMNSYSTASQPLLAPVAPLPSSLKRARSFDSLFDGQGEEEQQWKKQLQNYRLHAPARDPSMQSLTRRRSFTPPRDFLAAKSEPSKLVSQPSRCGIAAKRAPRRPIYFVVSCTAILTPRALDEVRRRARAS